MLHPMTYARLILAPRGSSDTSYRLSRCVRAVLCGEDRRKDDSFDLRKIVEAYIRFGILFP